jgi:hypothetical protein
MPRARRAQFVEQQLDRGTPDSAALMSRLDQEAHQTSRAGPGLDQQHAQRAGRPGRSPDERRLAR